MSTSNKSPVIFGFEQSVAELQRAVECGDDGTQEMLKRYAKIDAEARAMGTKADLEYLDRIKLQGHQVCSELLAEHGYPVPGNDPQRPN